MSFKRSLYRTTVPIGMYVEWTQLLVAILRRRTYEFCGTNESPLKKITIKDLEVRQRLHLVIQGS